MDPVALARLLLPALTVRGRPELEQLAGGVKLGEHLSSVWDSSRSVEKIRQRQVAETARVCPFMPALLFAKSQRTELRNMLSAAQKRSQITAPFCFRSDP